jgi:hypothetical protein
MGKSAETPEGVESDPELEFLLQAFHEIRMAYGYTDEYILTKDREWLQDTLDRIFDSDLNEYKRAASVHGIDPKEIGAKQEDVPEPTEGQLREVGIKFAGR